MPGLSLWSWIGPKTPPGSIVTIRIRSWRPAMPSISGPRSTVASSFTVTPFVAGAGCSLFIVFASLYFILGTGQAPPLEEGHHRRLGPAEPAVELHRFLGPA